MKYVLLLALILSGCGQKPQGIDPAFQSYLDRFKNYAVQEAIILNQDRLDNLSIQFGETPSNSPGICSKPGFSFDIIINRNYWFVYQDDLQRETILFHELGHCLLNRPHDNDLKEDRTPVSLMFWQAVNSDWYRSDQNRYIHELFHPAQSQ